MIQHPIHDLYPYHRHAIYTALGPKGDQQTDQLRLTLSLLVVRHILPIWQEERPNNNWPEYMLNLVEGVLRGTIPRQEIENIVKTTDFITSMRLWEQFDTQGASELSSRTFYVAETIGELLYEAIGAYRFDGSHLTDDLSDAEVTDPWSSDLALLAVCAYAGPAWKAASDSTKRRAFWTWWLTEAIPTAWHTIHP